jgi:hypothetical protein
MRTSHPPPDHPAPLPWVPRKREEEGAGGRPSRQAVMLRLTPFVVQTEVERER